MDEIVNSFQALNDKLLGWVNAAIQSLPNLVVAILIVAAFWFLARWVYGLAERALSRSSANNNNLSRLIASSLKIAVIGLGVILALGVLKLDKALFSLLAGVGVIGLALGFAFQDLVSNFVAGVMIAIRSPYRVGDVINVKDTMGSVHSIRLRDTVVRNFSGQHVLIPNKDFMTNEVTNYSIDGLRRVEIPVGVAYDAPLRDTKTLLVAAVSEIEGALKEPAPFAVADSLGESSVNFNVYFWIKYPGGDYGQMKEEGIIRIKEALDSKGIGIPFPTRTLEVSQGLADQLRELTTGANGRKPPSAEKTSTPPKH